MTLLGMFLVMLAVGAYVVGVYKLVHLAYRRSRRNLSTLFERRAFEHISLMKKFPNDAITVNYFVPIKRTIEDRVFRRQRLHLFTYHIPRSDESPIIPALSTSEYEIKMSTGEYFVFALKKTVNTTNRNDAMKTYEYLSNRKRLNGAIGLP